MNPPERGRVAQWVEHGGVLPWVCSHPPSLFIPFAPTHLSPSSQNVPSLLNSRIVRTGLLARAASRSRAL